MKRFSCFDLVHQKVRIALMNKRKSNMIKTEVIDLIEENSPFFTSTVHGVNHWRTVERNGHYLAEFNQADKKVISYFAYFHDCMRENEHTDPEHGIRGALFAEKHRQIPIFS